MESAPCPTTPRWNVDRPFLTGRFHQEIRPSSNTQTAGGVKGIASDSFSNRGSQNSVGYYHNSVQELLVIEDLLSAMVGIEGRYISIKRVCGKDSQVAFQVDASMDLALQEMAKRIFPLCENFLAISQFVELRSQFKNGLVNHAFAAALRALLLDYQAMVAQLEHQFRLGRLSIQGLWFFCQPMMGSMHALSIVIEKASANDLSGSAVLNLLQSQAKAMAGDNAVRSLLEKMTQCASAAYLRILERWVYEGVIDDPYGEFFIAENKLLQKESLTQDYDAKFWQQRYSLKDGIPSFLTSAAGTILTTGKYLNVMRECGHNVQVPISENSKLTSFGSNHHYLECIKAAYDFASGELLNLIKEKYDLMGKLRSLKRYLLLDQGDFLVHFMDIARDELVKRPDDISVEKLQSLLDLALRTTAAAADPCHEELTCCVGVRAFNKLGTAISRSSVLCRSMLKFINSLLHYLTFEVLEPNWHVMHNRLLTAKSIDEVIQHHDFFLKKCLKECLLLLPQLLKKVEKLKSICLQYAAAIQWLVPSLYIPKPETIESSSRQEKSKPRRSRHRLEELNLSPENMSVSDSVMKFEKEFNTELQSLRPILSSSSQAEPYLTHLAQCILGIGNDYIGY
ncbi:gamma-tubulin complex component 2-like isoform X10 [Magnolia sinica]|uniref:gamma-tubulin complex component 2-like isoform X10 n=1 Tax=Magnolia sinica TaxID=86752 RepID=UPI00265B225D|nr:gamma-tubulin complex component 2-like isoform X10 [Magnolia sinica]